MQCAYLLCACCTGENADFISVPLGYAEGSNRVMEKLVSGNWDEQFLIVPPGMVIDAAEFLELSSSK